MFWLKYRYPDGQFAGVAVIEATALLIARLEASVFGLDDGLVFAGGDKIDDASAEQIPQSMVDQLLDRRELRRLRRLCLSRKPLAPVNNRQRRRRQRDSDTTPPLVRGATTPRRAGRG